ncbi:hypothetical protein [Bradyrhizobium sp. McL0615]|jgi:hypothetical protein|uniref:hypothetical protein n=1 Tax=Bradyrhizobium sp. McL0615 TaxID=3415673 RepID=UPI003CF64233
MMISDVVYDLFAVFNAFRLACYLQQIYQIARDTTGVRAISYPIWTLWTAANSSTAIYSLTHPGNITLAWIYGLNALCCTVVMALTAFKQRQYHARIGQIPAGYPNVFDYASACQRHGTT